MYSSLRPHELQPARLLCPWDFPGKNIGVGYHFLLQGTFPTQGQNSSLASAGGFFTTSITWESISKTLDSNNSGNGACVLISHVRLCNSMDCSPPGSSVHGILQARIFEWATFPSPGHLFHPVIKPSSLISPAQTDMFFTTRATWEAQSKHPNRVNRILEITSKSLLFKAYIFLSF